MKKYYKMTIGVKELCEEKEIHWLLDAILSYQIYAFVKNEPFQSWKLSRSSRSTLLLTGDDGNGNIFIQDEIPYSDFPGDHFKIWLCNGMFLLPHEY